MNRLKITALATLALIAGTAAAQQPVIGLITKTETNPFFVKMKEGAAEAAKAKGAKLISGAGKTDGDNAGQVTAMENMIAAGAKTILITHLQQTNRFSVLDRDNMGEIQQEAAIKGQAQRLKGADYVVTGDVTEFGRKETGDHQLFGILGRGKTQVAYAKVNLNIVNISTSEVVYSTQGAGEYALSNREIIGFGGTSGYDSTLNGKVLDLAVREAVNRLVEGMEKGAWKP